MNTTTGDRPIGLVLRTLDRLIDERFDRTLTGRGVTRRQWQLLNTLAGGPATLDTLTAAVAAFLDRSAGETADPTSTRWWPAAPSPGTAAPTR
jgi:hypothetical protein